MLSVKTSSKSSDISNSSHRFGYTSDGRAVPAANPAHPHATAAGTQDQFQSTPEPRNRGPVGSRLSSLGAGWRWVIQAHKRLEASWVGDVLALICIAIGVYVFLVAGWVLS